MLRSHVPPVKGSKTVAIVNLTGKKDGPVLRACALARQASLFGFGVSGTMLEDLQQN
jgi:hypothetical protein